MLRDDNNGQATTHIRECHGDSNQYTPYRERTWPTRRTHGPLGLTYDNHLRSPYLVEIRALLPGWSISSQWSFGLAVILGCLILLPLDHLKIGRDKFDKVVTRLLGLPGPIKSNKWLVQIKAFHRGQNDVALNRHRQGYHLGTSE
jgi:hypothetical protein